MSWRVARAAGLWTLSIALAATIASAVVFGRRRASDPTRCTSPFLSMGARCCLPAQHLVSGACAGTAAQCPAAFDRVGDACVIRRTRVRVAPGRMRLGPGDWEAQGQVSPRDVVVERELWLDSHEVTVRDWTACVLAGSCTPLPMAPELGQPAAYMSSRQAKDYCAWVGGRLPRDDEWLLAAAGQKARRYPWGDTGAVCRRANWGVRLGPCATGATAPDLAGSHESDRTPEGVYDLAGGVAEWVQGSAEPFARGGSWATAFAAELRTWHARTPPVSGDAETGLRCAYDQPPIADSPSGATSTPVLPSAPP